METKYILELKNITKKYPGVTALSDISFKIKKGTILSLVGENGAGKSTLLKVISGVISKAHYRGDVLYNGVPTRYKTIRDSEKDGIAIIHQELAISQHLTLYENLFIGNYKSKFGKLSWNEMIKQAKYYLRIVGLDYSPYEIAGNLSVANQQLLEIAKALAKNAKLLILDEPTSSLNDKDSYALLDKMKELRDKEGVTCVFVSHKLKEVEYVADNITVIRDGLHISDYDNKTEKITEKKLIKDIVGRDLTSKFPKKETVKIGSEALRIENFTVASPIVNGKFDVLNSSFDIKYGEIVGLAGLVGSGRTELAKNIFGKSHGHRISGKIYKDGKLVNWNHPEKAIKDKFMYASEDRKHEGLIQMFSIHENINMASNHIFTNKLGIIKNNEKIINSSKKKLELNIKVPNVYYNVDTLSGGNQQKVLLAKALTTQADIIVIDEPTKGIDVGSKYEIYSIIQKLALKNKAILVISSEIEELLGITNRIFVMNQGVIKGQMPTQKATPERIMEMAIS